MRLVDVRNKERERATSAFVVVDADPTVAHVEFVDSAVQASAARRLAR
jgi:hypothetical protein